MKQKYVTNKYGNVMVKKIQCVNNGTLKNTIGVTGQ